MIPDPLRSWWHGTGNRLIAQSILDVNKVYPSMFDMFGICEAIKKWHYTSGRSTSRDILGQVQYIRGKG